MSNLLCINQIASSCNYSALNIAPSLFINEFSIELKLKLLLTRSKLFEFNYITLKYRGFRHKCGDLAVQRGDKNL